ncbi:MAG TPA: patatin-like phospholipase family protein [Candidatus Limnocylindrales bacterium]
MAETALVLGGGGVTGVAWELGILAGLADAGVDLASADLVIGTSAGSIVGTFVAAGEDLEARYQRQLAPPSGEIAARMGAPLFARYALAMLRSRDAQSFGVRMGRLALATKTISAEERRQVIADRLGVTEWPERRLLVTAVDATTGEFRAFDRSSGASISDAVGASCAVPGVWPPVTIDGRPWIDGGMRSPTNADLASGCSRVVIIAPTTFGGRGIPGAPGQAAALRAAGAEVALITPDPAARQAIGRNVLDPARRAASARAGRAQAATVADAVAKVWTGA